MTVITELPPTSRQERSGAPLGIEEAKLRRDKLLSKLQRTRNINQVTFARFVRDILDSSSSMDQAGFFRTAILYGETDDTSIHLLLNGEHASMSARRGSHEERIEFIEFYKSRLGFTIRTIRPCISIVDPKAKGKIPSLLLQTIYFGQDSVNQQPLKPGELHIALGNAIGMIGNPSPYHR